MRKKICVQEADEVEIRFRDKVYVATFNMRAMGYMQEALQECKTESLSYEHFADQCYSKLRVNHPDITQEEGNAMALTMRPSDMSEIIEAYVQSVNGVGIAENEEALKKAIAQMLGAKGGQ